MTAIDLFAGPGGWDLAAVALGLDPLGIEYDAEACATREAAGLRTLRADVADLDPLDFGPCDVLIGSPPCQGFSTAGKRGGARDAPIIFDAARALLRGEDRRDEYAERCEDPRSLLVLEPLRWALALRPRVMLLEQVPPVLPLWKWFAANLYGERYYTWAAILNAADYGVPQIRKRAFLIAHAERSPQLPRPTHSENGPILTSEGVRERWVTMAQALGWGMSEEPSGTVVSVSSNGGPRSGALDGGSGSRRRYKTAKADGRWVELRLNPGKTSSQPNRRLYDPAEEPAPTIAFGHDAASWAWEGPAPTLVTGRRSKDGGLVGRQLPEGEGENVGGHGYVSTGPATVVQGDARIFHPGGHKANDGRDNSKMRGRSEGIRVAIGEAALLQGFPADYPFQGTKSKQFQQVGNAVPPPLAYALLKAALE